MYRCWEEFRDEENQTEVNEIEYVREAEAGAFPAGNDFPVVGPAAVVEGKGKGRGKGKGKRDGGASEKQEVKAKTTEQLSSTAFWQN